MMALKDEMTQSLIFGKSVNRLVLASERVTKFLDFKRRSIKHQDKQVKKSIWGPVLIRLNNRGLEKRSQSKLRFERSRD